MSVQLQRQKELIMTLKGKDDKKKISLPECRWVVDVHGAKHGGDLGFTGG